MSNKTFTHYQTTPSLEWVVYHQLGKNVVSEVFITNDEGKLEKILPLSVIYINDETLKITFSSAKIGRVKVI